MARTLLFTGSCNRALPYFETANGKGIAAFWFDDETGALVPAGVIEGIDNPTFIAIDSSRRVLYATSEVLGWNEGTVTAYAIDPASGGLDYINKQPTRGSITAQVSFDRTGRYLFCVNYSVGTMADRPNRSVVVFPLAPDGSLGPVVSDSIHEGKGSNVERQDRSHPHCARVTPDNRFLVVTDLGMDRLVIYRFDEASGKIERHGETILPDGSGPRHLVFHPKSLHAYVVNELNSTVACLRYHADEGALELLSIVPALPGISLRQNHCSEISVTPDGAFLIVANRGADCLSVFDIDCESGRATLKAVAESGGKTPRHFSLDPSERFIVVANQDSDQLNVFSLGNSGGLSLLGPSIAAGTPTAIAFLEALRE